MRGGTDLPRFGYFTLLKAHRHDDVCGVIVLRINDWGDPRVEMDGWKVFSADGLVTFWRLGIVGVGHSNRIHDGDDGVYRWLMLHGG